MTTLAAAQADLRDTRAGKPGAHQGSRDFPFDWERPDDRELSWKLDRVHWPGPLSPLVFEVAGEPVAEALMSAASTYAMPIAEVRIRRINGYRYQSTVPLISDPIVEAQRRGLEDRLRVAMGALDELWAGTWLPHVKAHLEYWRSFRLPDASLPALLHHLDETMARVAHIWRIHFLLAVPMQRAIQGFAALHRELFGGTTLDAMALLRGFDTETLRARVGMSDLSNLARRTPPVRDALCGDAPRALDELERRAECRGFLASLRAYLDRYGERGEDLDLERPSWIEDPLPVIERLKALINQEENDLVTETATADRQRARLVADARAGLEGHPGPVREEFQFLLGAAQQATVLTEDHNWWIDARCMHQVRMVFLELGRRFVGSGYFARVEDVFYLRVDELKGAAYVSDPGLARAVIAGRRAEMERFRAMTPPDVLGARPTTRTPREAIRVGMDSSGPLTRLRGHPCSAGTVRGIARIVSSLSQAGTLQPGDVLVTEQLSPSWTPLFATASAVVAERGGVLSHAAVVAREYGIPAVLGVGAATSVIHDGQVVEVDGAAGTISVIPDRAEQ